MFKDAINSDTDRQTGVSKSSWSLWIGECVLLCSCLKCRAVLIQNVNETNIDRLKKCFIFVWHSPGQRESAPTHVAPNGRFLLWVAGSEAQTTLAGCKEEAALQASKFARLENHKLSANSQRFRELVLRHFPLSLTGRLKSQKKLILSNFKSNALWAGTVRRV